jgi:hypothetical protein
MCFLPRGHRILVRTAYLAMLDQVCSLTCPESIRRMMTNDAYGRLWKELLRYVGIVAIM